MPDAPRRILVTGSAGFLGIRTVDCLTTLPSTELVVALDVQPTRLAVPESRRFVTVVRDVREPLEGVLADFGIDAVVHLAFLLRTQRDARLARSVNVDATANLLRACEATGVKQVVYLSSATVYGADSTYTKPRSESDPVRPVRGFQYSEHKAEAERLLLDFAARDGSRAVAILRGSVIMAPDADNFIARALGQRLLPVPLGANAEMQFLHIDDFASAMAMVLTRRAHGIFNIAGNGTVKWRDIAAASGALLVPVPAPALSALTGLGWKLRLQNQSPPSGLSFIRHPWLVSTEKIEAELGWSPRYSSRDALTAWLDARPKAGR